MGTHEPQSFASLIREYRLAAGLTQEELAERAGISARSVSDLERGLYQVPHRDTVARLAAALTPDAAGQLEAAIVRQRGPLAFPQPGDRDMPLPAKPPLPTGVITFLAAEVDAADQLRERNPEVFRNSLARLSTLLERCIEARKGVVVQSHSDEASHLAVFHTASDAAAAAVELQQLSHLEPWPHQVPLRLRLALHTTEAVQRDGEYFGSPLTRVQRLRALAAGGQTLLSHTAGDLVRTSLPSGAALRELGEHNLIELAAPERVFELTSPGVPHEFPSLRTTSSINAHYDTVLRGLLDGRVVLFTGEAINRYGRLAGGGWQRGQLESLPTDDEVAASLASTFDYPPDAPQELIRVAQYVSTMAGSGPLFEELRDIFSADYSPTPLHQFLASLPAALGNNGRPSSFPLIVTCSYDDALERAFLAAGQPFDLVSYVAEGDLRGRFWHRPPEGRPRLIDKPNKYIGLSFDTRTIILKVHGTLDRADAEHDSFVVTEDHFLDYLAGGDFSNLVPVTIAAKLRRSHFLFLGYGLRDWNLRVILRRLWGEQRLSYKSWAVHAEKPDPMEHGLWRERGVDVLDVRLEDYLDGLRKRMNNATRTAN